MSDYSIKTVFPGSFDEAVKAVQVALKEQGFGVLCDIDVSAKLKEKLNKDIGPYRILGACHPPSADKAIELEPSIGLLLPCNVVIRKSDDVVVVEAINPTVALRVVANDQLMDLAGEIENKLSYVVNQLSS